MTSAAERFLLDFHARYPGATTAALGTVPVACAGQSFESSYDALVARVPAHAGRVLDVACGDGFLLARLAASRRHAQLAGVDMSESELAVARTRLQGRAKLVQGNAHHLPFRDAEFDAVVSHMALMLMDDVRQVLAEVRRVLGAGGRLAAIVAGAFPASPALDVYRALVGPQVASTRIVIGDPRWREAGGIPSLLVACGFADVVVDDVTGELVLPPEQMWEWLMLMYDAHFMDTATRDMLRARYLEQAPGIADAGGLLHVPLRWSCFEATVA